MKLKDSKTEDVILDAAKVVFMEFGLYGARMQQIADRAGINKALLHYYFRNKERLFDRVFENALARYFQNMEVLQDESLPIIDRIHSYADRFIDFLTEYPQMAIFLIKEVSLNQPLFEEKVNSHIKENPSLIAVINQGIQRGEIQFINAMLFFVNLVSLCTYPFVARPIFKVVAANNDALWGDEQEISFRASIHEFINNKIKPL
jgi:AcrR family transcriptional regulator